MSRTAVPNAPDWDMNAIGPEGGRLHAGTEHREDRVLPDDCLFDSFGVEDVTGDGCEVVMLDVELVWISD